MDKQGFSALVAVVFAWLTIAMMIRNSGRPVAPNNAHLSCLAGCLILMILGLLTVIFIGVNVL